MTNQSCAFVLRLTAKPGERSQLLAKIVPFFDALAKEEGFIRAHVHEAAEDADLLVVYEAWAIAAEDFMPIHKASPAVREHNPLLEPHVADRDMQWLVGPAAWTSDRSGLDR